MDGKEIQKYWSHFNKLNLIFLFNCSSLPLCASHHHRNYHISSFSVHLSLLISICSYLSVLPISTLFSLLLSQLVSFLFLSSLNNFLFLLILSVSDAAYVSVCTLLLQICSGSATHWWSYVVRCWQLSLQVIITH